VGWWWGSRRSSPRRDGSSASSPSLFLPLLFPNGHLPSRRWVPFAWFCVGVLAFLFVAVDFATPKLTGSASVARVENPLYISAIDTFEIPDVVISILLLIVLVGAVGSLVVRFRRARGDERQQMKWVALALALLVFAFVLSEVLLQLGGSRATWSTPSSRASRSSPYPCRSGSPCCGIGCTSSTSS
jgi:hypothetical protein